MTLSSPTIDVGRIEDDLRRLIRIPSVTGSEEAIQSEILRLFEEIGLETQWIEADPEFFAEDPDFPGAEMPRTSLRVITGTTGREGGRRLLLVGHVDVVPPGDLSTWTADPWGGEVRDGAICDRRRS